MENAKKSVVVGLSGGLGNQMFQYAAGRALALRLGVGLELDLSWFAGRKERLYALGAFAINAKTRGTRISLPDFLKRFESRVSRRWASRRMGVPIYRERHFHFDPAFLGIDRPLYLEGYWQSERYFTDFRAEILRDFSLCEPFPASCLAIEEQMLRAEPICVHVRRGDYVSNPVAAETHGLCSLDYYQRGVSTLAAGLARPRAFIFSDDPDWVREHLKLPVPATIVDVNSGPQAHWDLHLMALCRHFVIANSSLSWWGAWLGRAEDKKVIAPATWFRASVHDTRDLIPEAWQRI
ncbi:alpha-1,2-fucosyltransferase [Pollutimonas sp. M17]|uniref:alpha-1,2-fucosyltransferase n=1 Tax=Pollutimonas sp. M17 TaxID=2962065 RepID=UPI0021F3CA28|nr:alpha-1,2-fucosyltransferase [Pollutimonas sp. M17]UYO93994.1 alpha-1,2-fucosyltransferase [Pollutimonas sp. M17]